MIIVVNGGLGAAGTLQGDQSEMMVTRGLPDGAKVDTLH